MASDKNSYVIINGELYHYGVLGMKWGKRKTLRRTAANERLQKKALKYDKKAAALTVKSEKAHNKIDLERANNKGVKAAKLEKKSAALLKKANTVDNDYKRLNMEKKQPSSNIKLAK